jgi:hypothetical protein
MRVLKIIGVTLGVLIVLFFIIGMFLPSEVHIKRSLLIPASSEVVFNEVNDLRKWKEWSPWYEMDPNMEITYEGFLMGEGASYSWESEVLGDGKLTITESHPNQYIATDMHFMEQGTAMGYYRFESVEDGTLVTWGIETDMGNNPFSKYMGLLMDDMVGDDFEKGLQNLKTHVENLPDKEMMRTET